MTGVKALSLAAVHQLVHPLSWKFSYELTSSMHSKDISVYLETV